MVRSKLRTARSTIDPLAPQAPDRRALEQNRLINCNPRPRVLIRGFSAHPELVERLLGIAETTRHIKSLNEVRQAEWDLIITDSNLSETNTVNTVKRRVSIDDHLFAIVVTPDAESRQSSSAVHLEDPTDWSHAMQVKFGHICQELRRIPGLPPSVAHLVHEQLEPVLKNRLKHSVIERADRANFGPSVPSTSFRETPQVEPFIETGDERPLAGRYHRSSNAEVWVLPDGTPDLLPWVHAAIGEWHRRCPDRFPGFPDWSQETQWQTSSESKLADDLEKLHEERANAIASFETREHALQIQLDAATADANAYERALLTQQSDPLKQAVQRALEELGFTVVDADGENPDDDHLEDLRVEDPDTPGWICLTEVKGYGKGAQTAAIAQFIRFQARFQQRTGRPANALWYVVNQFKDRDPSTRQPVLNGKEEDITAFSAAGGLVIDTVQLFRLLQQVQLGTLAASEARKLLRSGEGRFCV